MRAQVLHLGGDAMAQPITLPDCATKLLEFLYPNVDWTRVIFYDGLPIWVSTFSSTTVGITLPDPLSLSAFRVYLKDTNFCVDVGNESDAISTLVHEAFHVQQYMASAGGGYGIGWFRPGFFNYLICLFSCGTTDENKGNAFEDAAYQQEHCFTACRQNQPKVCDCTSGVPVFDPAGLNALGACHGKPDCKNPLIVREPRVPSDACGPWWKVLGAFILVAILMLFLIGLTWIFLLDLLNCKYLEIRSRQCREWGQRVRRECKDWADHGYSQCNKWADEGYSTCKNWSTSTSSHCCTWAPCSWFCKVLVWITTTICTLTVWVFNWVCKITVWIIHMVCIAWATFFEVICLVWTTVIRTILLCWWR